MSRSTGNARVPLANAHKGLTEHQTRLFSLVPCLATPRSRLPEHPRVCALGTIARSKPPCHGLTMAVPGRAHREHARPMSKCTRATDTPKPHLRLPSPLRAWTHCRFAVIDPKLPHPRHAPLSSLCRDVTARRPHAHATSCTHACPWTRCASTSPRDWKTRAPPRTRTRLSTSP